MTIRPGDSWGREVARPDDLVTVASDRELAATLAAGASAHLAITQGDLARTLGVSERIGAPLSREFVNELPIDLIEVSVDGGPPVVACAHVVARSPWYRGLWLRGPIVAVMNAEFIGDWDIAPRGHPNDGRVEVFEVSSSMSWRHRVTARRRLPSATHLPHPDISSRSVRTCSWEFARRLDIAIDGRRVGRASSLEISVVADAAVVYA